MNRFIEIKLVQIADRQRKTFDESANQELVTSIQSIGLLQCPVLELSAGAFHLRAGERRIRAIQDIYALGGSFSYDGKRVPDGMLPYTLWEELTPLQRLEIEVAENNCREAFTWQERAEATSKLAELRALQALEAGTPAPSVADIAQETRGSVLGSAHTNTRNDLILSKYLADPDVAGAKTPREAMLILKKKEQAAQHLKLAETFGKNHVASAHRCFNADAREWMITMPSDEFDVIITDPPYGVGAHSFGSSESSATAAHEYEDTEEVLEEILRWLPRDAYRVSKPQAHFYAFCDIDWFGEWKAALTNAGWKVFRTPLIWVRPTGFRTPWIEQGPQRKYETIVYAVKGERHVNMIAPDVIILQSAGEGLGHPAAKPPGIYEELLRRSVRPGDSVLDPFCGSGPVFGAATALRCKGTGVEINPTFYGIALSQMNKVVENAELEGLL